MSGIGYYRLCCLLTGTMHETTGFSPFKLVFGRHVRGPLDMIRDQWEGMEDLPVSVAEYLDNLYTTMEDNAKMAGEKALKAKETSKIWFNQKARECAFNVGNSVLVL